jgi:hypothetical protein
LKGTEYKGSLSNEELVNIINSMSRDIENSKKQLINVDTDAFLIKENSKVFIVYYYNLTKRDVKLLVSRYKFELVNDIKKADVIILPSYKGNSHYFNIYTKYKHKLTGYTTNYISYRENDNDYNKFLWVSDKYENVNHDILEHIKDKTIITTDYLRSVAYLISNPQKESVEEYNTEALLALLQSNDMTNVNIALSILKNKNIKPILFELFMIYFSSSSSYEKKAKIKETLFDKIPFLATITGTPSNAYLDDINNIKYIVKVLKQNDIPCNLDYLIDIMKNAKISTSWRFLFDEAKHMRSISEINTMILELKKINIELTNDQIEQLLLT